MTFASRNRIGQDVSMARPAAECFEVQTRKRGLKWSGVGGLLGALFLHESGGTEYDDNGRVRVTVVRKDTREILFDEPSGDAALAHLAKKDLATLDEAEFRDRWEIA